MATAAMQHLVPDRVADKVQEKLQKHRSNDPEEIGQSQQQHPSSTSPHEDNPTFQSNQASYTTSREASHDPSRHGTPGLESQETTDHERKSRAEEKELLSRWQELKRPLSPSQVAEEPGRKMLGHSAKYLHVEDFELLKTLGTGTFARVWLVRLAEPQPGDENKVFALKILRKVDVIRLKQVEHVRNERNVLAAVAGHPFITTMVASFQDRDSLYMLLDYCPGGEVFSYLRRARRFNEPTAQFYSAEILLILEYLHETEGVAYRDLKPENILIDAEGHLKLVDFGFAKKVDNRETYTLCGTPEYLAPEVIRNTGHGTAVDWWAFGILIYEFLVGQPPFWDQNPMKIYEQIVEGRLRFPSAMSSEARTLISGLCTVDTSKRLGNISGGAKSVKTHPFFRNINWDDLWNRRARGPIVPYVRGPADTRNFDEYDPEPENRERYSSEMAAKWDEAFKDF